MTHWLPDKVLCSVRAKTNVCLFLYTNINLLNVTKPEELIKNNLLKIY